MAHRGVVADTGIFIQYLRATTKEKTNLYFLPNQVQLHTTVITGYELLIGASTKEKTGCDLVAGRFTYP